MIIIIDIPIHICYHNMRLYSLWHHVCFYSTVFYILFERAGRKRTLQRKETPSGWCI